MEFIHYNLTIIILFKCGKVIKGAQAAYTYLESFPDDDFMLDNMKFYKSLALITDDLMFSLEPVPHIVAYFKAVKHYEGNQWQDAVNAFEETLKEYYKAYEECRYSCEEKREKNMFLGKAGLFDAYVDVLRCRSECPNKLATLHNNVVPKYLPRHYNYLQMAYWQGQFQELLSVNCSSIYSFSHPFICSFIQSFTFSSIHSSI